MDNGDTIRTLWLIVTAVLLPYLGIRIDILKKELAALNARYASLDKRDDENRASITKLYDEKEKIERYLGYATRLLTPAQLEQLQARIGAETISVEELQNS